MKMMNRCIVTAIFWSVSVLSFAIDSSEAMATNIAKHYLLEKLNWRCGDFIIGPDNYILESVSSNLTILRATHKDDINLNTPGARKSLQFHIDKSRMEIVKVLGYQ